MTDTGDDSVTRSTPARTRCEASRSEGPRRYRLWRGFGLGREQRRRHGLADRSDHGSRRDDSASGTARAGSPSRRQDLGDGPGEGASGMIPACARSSRRARSRSSSPTSRVRRACCASSGADRYAEELAEHRRLIRQACTDNDGVEVDTQGDAFFFAFPAASRRRCRGGAAHGVACGRPDPGSHRHPLRTTPLDRGGLRRGGRPPSSESGGSRARRSGCPLGHGRGSRRRPRAHRPRRAPPRGRRRTRRDLSGWRRELPAAEDDLEHEPAPARELLCGSGARGRRGARAGSRAATDSSR